ncbi:unnamed protein product [Protopolystoma xenopodis]|uniref:Dynein heavy chain AAA module D4 domain-containing protein n=1 Tax=Protopolystoma xenopodis TaxID=117903 RepID=A0A3S5A9S2_9PLAT|nr:unnamed protein product [Protopolystoma xenopodis]
MMSCFHDLHHTTDASSATMHRGRRVVHRGLICTILQSQLKSNRPTVSGLFSRDEMDELLSNLVSTMKKEFPKRPPENELLLDYFMQRVRKNLHIVLCFSPVGEKFRQRALYFPGLISGCTIDWYHRWPQDALHAVAQSYLGEFDITCTTAMKGALIQMMASVHDDVAAKCQAYFVRYRRTTHVTPKSYICFLTAYKKIYQEQVS